MTPDEIASLTNKLFKAFHVYFGAEESYELTKIALRSKLENDFSFLPPPVD